MRYDLHTHDDPASYFELIRNTIDRAVTSIEGLDIPAHENQTIFSGTALRIPNNV
jgi:hypothetical protein